MQLTNIRVKILKEDNEIPLEVGKTYRVNFETSSHYIIFNQGIWCGIFKDKAEKVEPLKALENGQIIFNI